MPDRAGSWVTGVARRPAASSRRAMSRQAGDGKLRWRGAMRSERSPCPARVRRGLHLIRAGDECARLSAFVSWAPSGGRCVASAVRGRMRLQIRRTTGRAARPLRGPDRHAQGDPACADFGEPEEPELVQLAREMAAW